MYFGCGDGVVSHGLVLGGGDGDGDGGGVTFVVGGVCSCRWWCCSCFFCGGGGTFVLGSDDGGGGVVVVCLRHFWHSAWHDSQWLCSVRVAWL